MSFFSPKLLEALEFASIAHKGQLRKFPANVPYISHLAAVAGILSRAGFREEVIIAGLLHDIIEDTNFNAEDIQEPFGGEVLALVTAVTENKSLPWAERKEKYLKQIETASEEAKAISAADLFANRMSNLLGLRRGENPWTKFSRQPVEYARRIFEIDTRRLNIIKNSAKIPFIAELEAVMKEVEDLTWQMLEKYQQ
jgi:guanosine-3',5'-bis(diphosphate) 3'-pyrophosphohydrolase